jgi:hypothetical protein
MSQVIPVNARIVMAVAVLAAVNCDKSATPLHPGVSSFCTVALSGAVTGTYDCQAASVTWSSADSLGTFSFSVAGSGTTPGIGVTIAWPNEPIVGRTYANSDSAAQAVLAVTTSGGQTWKATVGGSTAAAGSYALAFTSVVINLREPNGNLYAAEGTLNASLPAVSTTGATGVVLLSAAF